MTEDPDGQLGRRLGATRTSSSTCTRGSSRSRWTATPGGDVVDVRPHQDGHDRRHLRRDAARLLRPRRPRQGLRAQLGRRLAAVPDLPPLLRPDLLRGRRQGARAGLRAGLQRLDGRGVVRAVAAASTSRSASCPLWDVELAAAEIQRNAERGVRAVLLQRAARTTSACPSIHTGDWDPLFQVCNDTGVTLCMHIGSSSTNPAASPDAPGGRGRHARVQQLDGVAWPTGCSRGKLIAVPEAEARVLRGPDRLDPLRARAGRHGVGAARQLA